MCYIKIKHRNVIKLSTTCCWMHRLLFIKSILISLKQRKRKNVVVIHLLVTSKRIKLKLDLFAEASGFWNAFFQAVKIRVIVSNQIHLGFKKLSKKYNWKQSSFFYPWEINNEGNKLLMYINNWEILNHLFVQ